MNNQTNPKNQDFFFNCKMQPAVIAAFKGWILSVTPPKVEIELTKTNFTLKPPLEQNTLTAKVTPATANATKYKFEIKDVKQGTWYSLIEGTSKIHTFKPTVAGRFKVRVTATFTNFDVVSDEKEFEVLFPSYDDIASNSDVVTTTNNAWNSTINAGKNGTFREEGFWIKFNTASEKFEFSATILGTPYMVLGARPADSPSTITPLNKPTFTVASFHTHTPSLFTPNGREVGPSDNDIALDVAQNITGLVYDYLATDPTGQSIPQNHPVDSTAITLQSGPERRDYNQP